MSTLPLALTKYKQESRLWAWSFEKQPEIIGGDTLQSIVSITFTDSLIVAVNSPIIAGTRVIQQVTNGSPGTESEAICKVLTAGGSTMESVAPCICLNDSNA